MTTIELNDQTADRLRELAAREQLSLEELIVQMLQRYEAIPASVTDAHAPSSLVDLARLAQGAAIQSGQTHISERSREILDTELADDLKRRMHDDRDTDDSSAG